MGIALLKRKGIFMNQDYTESSVILFLLFAVAVMFLQQYLTEWFIFVWKWFALACLFPVAVLPSFITDNLLFFWTSNLQEKAQASMSVLVQNPDYIYQYSVQKYGSGLTFVTNVNKGLTQMFAPYILLFFLFYVKKNYSKREFRKTFSIDTLVADQADLWPVIKPMVEIKPHETANLDEGEWAMCLEPMSFARKYGLIIESENKMGEKRIALDEEKMINVFSSQLGRQWKGIDDLTQEEKFVLAIFLLKANRKGDDAKELAGKIATAFSSEKKYKKKDLLAFMKIAVDESEKVLEKYKKSEVFLESLSQHYYVNTVLPRMLEFARVDGVLATADFIWLKPRNRTLWYILNNIGRNAAWVECAGIWHHYNYEKAIEKKLPSPRILGAVSALDLEFKESAEEYIPLKGYNDNKK